MQLNVHQPLPPLHQYATNSRVAIVPLLDDAPEDKLALADIGLDHVTNFESKLARLFARSKTSDQGLLVKVLSDKHEAALAVLAWLPHHVRKPAREKHSYLQLWLWFTFVRIQYHPQSRGGCGVSPVA